MDSSYSPLSAAPAQLLAASIASQSHFQFPSKHPWHWRIQGGTRDAPSGSKFFHFQAVFDKKIAKLSHFRSGTPPQEYPGSATGWSMQNRRQQHTTFSRCEYVCQQWRIQDFPDGTGASTFEFGAKTYYLTRILPKTE